MLPIVLLSQAERPSLSLSEHPELKYQAWLPGAPCCAQIELSSPEGLTAMTERQPPPSPQRLRYKFISSHMRSASWPGLAPINALRGYSRTPLIMSAHMTSCHLCVPPPFKRTPAPTPSVTIHPIYHGCGLAFCVSYIHQEVIAPPGWTIRPLGTTPSLIPSMTISAASKLTNAHAVWDWSGVHLAFRHCYADSSN